jgi:hypothetical protein
LLLLVPLAALPAQPLLSMTAACGSGGSITKYLVTRVTQGASGSNSSPIIIVVVLVSIVIVIVILVIANIAMLVIINTTASPICNRSITRTWVPLQALWLSLSLHVPAWQLLCLQMQAATNALLETGTSRSNRAPAPDGETWVH